MTAKEKLHRLAEQVTEAEAECLLRHIELHMMHIYNQAFPEEVGNGAAVCTDRQLQFFRGEPNAPALERAPE